MLVVPVVFGAGCEDRGGDGALASASVSASREAGCEVVSRIFVLGCVSVSVRESGGGKRGRCAWGEGKGKERTTAGEV